MNPTEYFEQVREALGRVPAGSVERAAAVLREARERHAMVWLVGNGGSAALASHFANDLVKACGVRAIALADQTPTVMAYGNDLGWEFMFANALARLSLKDDVLVAISCSGNSPNVVIPMRGVAWHWPVIALTGPDEENLLGKISTVVLRARHPNMRVQEDVHMAICHAIVGLLVEG